MIGELHRKAIHIFSLVIPVGYYVLPEESARKALLVAAVVAVVIEALRLNEPHLRNITFRLAGALLREHEKTGLFSSTYLILGSLLCAHSFSKPVVIAAVLFLILGDAAAALVGRVFGRTQIFDKTLEGSLACLGVCLAVGVLLGLVPDLDLPLKAAAAGAVTATVFELLPIPLDDNFRIPLSAGFAMRLVMS
jgi:dolichol kinase